MEIWRGGLEGFDGSFVILLGLLDVDGNCCVGNKGGRYFRVFLIRSISICEELDLNIYISNIGQFQTLRIL